MDLARGWIAETQRLYESGRPFVMATIVKTIGSTPRKPGARMMIVSESEFVGTIGGGQLELLVLAESMRLLKFGGTKILCYDLCPRTGQCCGGKVEVFLEVLNDQPHLVIFGAGHVGQALAQTMAGTTFGVHLVDDREDWIHRNDHKNGTDPLERIEKHQTSWHSFASEWNWDQERSYVVIMTPSHSMDEEIVEFFLKVPVAYLGLIGSRPKWAKFQQNLMNKGVERDLFQRVTSPIGLALGGGDAPKEIAISVAAQLLQIQSRKKEKEEEK